MTAIVIEAMSYLFRKYRILQERKFCVTKLDGDQMELTLNNYPNIVLIIYIENLC